MRIRYMRGVRGTEPPHITRTTCISLLSIPGKVYGKVIIERVQRLTEEKVNEEQVGSRKGRGCVDQIFSFRMVVEKILAKGK